MTCRRSGHDHCEHALVQRQTLGDFVSILMSEIRGLNIAKTMMPTCRQLKFEDVWKLFGEGKHPGARQLYEAKLAPFLSQASGKFWADRLWYFDKGLYYQGGQVSLRP